MSISNRVYELRKKKNLSQVELAKEAGISPAYVGKIEKGNAKPTGEVLKGLAKALDTTVNFLLDGRYELIDKNNAFPEKFVVVDEAREYIKKHLPAITSMGINFDVDKLSDTKILEMANEILYGIGNLGYKYKE